MAFPIYSIVYIYSQKFGIRYGCNLFIVIRNLNFRREAIIASCKWIVVGLIEVYSKFIYLDPCIYTFKNSIYHIFSNLICTRFKVSEG
jgi:hypothetical protein